MTNQSKITIDRKDILGRGGYGAIFKGSLSVNNKDGVEGTEIIDVAVKRLEIDTLEMNMKERELKQMELNHPNVVKLLHYEEDYNFIYFALELCDESLDKAFLHENNPEKYRGPLPNEVDFMLQLSQGLEYIHSKNLVHRDIKPDNILISSSTGKVVMKWSDFGLSKGTTRYGDYSMSGYRGTRNYWAPEIFEIVRKNDCSFETTNDETDMEIKITIMSDIFACACVFFKFLTRGVHPFGNDDEIIMNIRQSNPANLNKLSSSHFAFTFIKKMLSKQKEERPNLREIIPLLLSLQQRIKIDPVKSIDEAYQEINKSKKELHELCSMHHLNEQQINKLTQIVINDSIGLVNVVDDNGDSPLLLMCDNNNSSNLLPCIKVMLRKVYGKWEGSDPAVTTVTDVNYKDRLGRNALHSACISYEGGNIFDIAKLVICHGLNVNATDIESDSNALQWLLYKLLMISKIAEDTTSDLIFEIVRYMVDMEINLNHKNMLGITTLHVLCENYNDKNLINIVRWMTEKGADVTSKAFEGATVLNSLCAHYNQENLIDLVQYFIEAGVDANAKLPDGHWTALHHVCYNYKHNNLIDIVRLLIHVKGKDTVGITILHILCCQQYSQTNLIDLIRLAIIEMGVDVNAKTSDGWTALHYLCEKYTYDNLIDIVQWLIEEQGVDINAKNSYGYTPLHYLCTHYSHYNLINLIKLMLGRGADVNAKTFEGSTALYMLCHKYTQHDNLIDIIRLLIAKEADVKAKRVGGSPSLHSLCSKYSHSNLIDLVQLLIDNGADVSAKDENGMTALHLLCQDYRHDNLIDLVNLFIQSGADVNAKHENGFSALLLLCQNYVNDNLIDLVQLLIEKGADVNVMEETSKWNVLHLLCKGHYPHDNLIDLVRLLVEKGVDLNAKTNNPAGCTVLHVLCGTYKHKNLINLVRFFIEKGVDVNSHSSYGETAFLSLIRHYPHDNLIDLVQLLIDKGAADVATIKTSDGFTALHYLCNFYTHDNLIDLTKLLIENGANIGAKNQSGFTALDFLWRTYTHNHKLVRSSDLVRLLTPKGIDLVNSDLLGGRNLFDILANHPDRDNILKEVQQILKPK